MKLTTEGLARASSRRPWVTVGIWIVVVAIMGTLSSKFLADALTTDVNFTNAPEAVRALDAIEEHYGEEGVTQLFLISSEGTPVDDPEFASTLQAIEADVKATGGSDLLSVVTYADTQDPSMISKDGQTTLMPVSFKEDKELTDLAPTVDEIGNDIESQPGVSYLTFGAITLNEDFSTIAEEDLRKGEGIGIAVALIVLVAVFGAIVAGVIPILLAIASIAVAMGMVALAGLAFDFSFFVTNMVSMMGLAVGIDYSLFIVSRYREERHWGLEKMDAIAHAGTTASRAVFFSGMTVVLALMGMLIFPTTIFRSLAAGAIFVVIASIAASLTLLPAILSLLGDRVDSLRVLRHRRKPGDADAHPFWTRVTHGVMRRPVIFLVIGAGLLIVASLSYFDMNTGFSGVSTLPDDTPSKQAFVVLEEQFAGGLNSPIETVATGDVSSPEAETAIEDYQAALADDGIFGPTSVQESEDGEAVLIRAPLIGDPSSNAGTEAVERVRDIYVPAAFDGTSLDVLVGGEPAFAKDFFDLTDRFTPFVFMFVLGLSFILLMIVFRSIVVPIKAIIMNLLSVGAAYGLIVLVFQKGYGADFFGFTQVEAIEAWLPLFLFSVLFGLSMDYHVFLLSRIRERFDQTHDNTGSVAYGLTTTGGLITGAAIIMVAVFGGFAAGDLVSLQQMGFGLAVAVFFDATIVRSILVPATMKLLGDRNWYLPRWLHWLPDVRVEGHHDHPSLGLPEAERVTT